MDKIFYAVLVIAVTLGLAYVGYTTYTQKVELEALQRLYSTVDQITSYSQEVETSLMVSDRSIHVVGHYRNDTIESYFASFATTTLTIPDAEPFVFSLSNVVAKDLMRFRLSHVSGSLLSAAPMSDTWYEFPTDSIPAEYQGIAVPGPISDSLALFRDGGSALTLLKSITEETSFTEPLTRFDYALAPQNGSEATHVRAVRERLMGEGVISLWTDPGVTSVRYIVLSGTDYHSTTTIKSVNVPTPSEPVE